MNTLMLVQRLSRPANKLRYAAESVAVRTFDHDRIDPAHLLYAALLRPPRESAAADILQSFGFDMSAAHEYLRNAFPRGRNSQPVVPYSAEAKQMFVRADQFSIRAGHRSNISDKELVAAAADSHSEAVPQLLHLASVSPPVLFDALGVRRA